MLFVLISDFWGTTLSCVLEAGCLIPPTLVWALLSLYGICWRQRGKGPLSSGDPSRSYHFICLMELMFVWSHCDIALVT